ncbi:MAG: hypothetical protein JWO80_4204 [Bryobacterales bacterium]|nr:hypothetical protein [Bryobacterales bacterium]
MRAWHGSFSGPVVKKAARAACWTLPALFCLWLYRYSLGVWFQQDDFAWLSLHTQAYDWPSFWTQMFSPMAQGTIRPWSERGFFLLFYRLFGADALPYHIMVFATQIANLLLLAWIVLRLTGSRVAAFVAPLVWTANASLATSISWASSYNEILCAFFLLSAFALYLRGYYRLQLAVFVLGFGALELNVVYPAIVLAYVITCKRTREDLLRTVPLVAISIGYYVLHARVAPVSRTGPYALHLDASVFRTFATFWRWEFVPRDWTHARWEALSITAGFTALLVWHIVREARKRNYLPIFFLLWFVITLAPLLPLRDHVSAYYLTIPTVGLAMLLAHAFARPGAPWQALVPAIAALLYLCLQIPAGRGHARWYFDQSREIRTVVLGIRHARELHPGKAILLADVSPELYSLAIAHSPFHALDMPDVYLTSESAREILHSGQTGDISRFVLPAGPATQAVLNRQIEVYSLSGGRPRNITSFYEVAAANQPRKDFPRRVDVGVPLLGYLLGSTWYPLEVDHRWMPKWASVRMGGPRTIRDKLILTGLCPEGLIRPGPLKLRVSVDGEELAEAKFIKPEEEFLRSFSLPPDLVGKEHVDVTLEVSRTFQAVPGGRPLGLAFGVLEIQ